MGNYSKHKELEARIRASKPYADWVSRNKAAFCLRCGCRDNLECHHIVELYSVIRGLWKLYGNESDVYDHAIAMHENDSCEAATLCDECHNEFHPGRQPKPAGNARIEEWSAIPRNLKVKLAHSTRDTRSDALGLVAAQTLFGIGWHIMNGHLDTKILELNRRSFAKLIGKKACTSFNKSFAAGLKSLEKADILLGSHISGNNVELHLAPSFLKALSENPWFVPLVDVRTSRMCVLALKWFLGQQSKRKLYKIGLRKLCGHLGITTSHLPMASKAIKSACELITWTSVEIESGMCTFKIVKRRATPIHSLRQILTDSVNYGS
jgi:hypothetical protein